MKIKWNYKESNAIEDLTGDYVEIRMTTDELSKLRSALTFAKYNNEEIRKYRNTIIFKLETAESEAVWV